jgi:phosphatidate cytidylyltransferase
MSLFIGVCIWGPLPFAIGITVVAAVGLVELVRTYRACGIRPNLVLAALGLFGPIWVSLGTDWPLHGTNALQNSGAALGIAAAIAALGWEVVHTIRSGDVQAARNTGYGLLCGAYIALFAGLPALRAWPGVVASGPYRNMNIGLALVVVVACCVWATDSAALFVGKLTGRRKLAPVVSPGKTVEGAVGGLVGGIVIGGLFGAIFLGQVLPGLAIGLIAGFFGQLGDLFESALKREVGVKDFGNLFPGHGGALDRFDSFLFVAPLVWLGVWMVRILWPALMG